MAPPGVIGSLPLDVPIEYPVRNDLIINVQVSFTRPNNPVTSLSPLLHQNP